MKLFQKWFPTVRPVARGKGKHSKLVVALIADDLTRTCFEHVCTVLNVTPHNCEAVFRSHRPNFLFRRVGLGRLPRPVEVPDRVLP